ncbi:MAG: hypothetical protein ABI625_07875 [bacterium]
MLTESPSYSDPQFELSIVGFAAAVARRGRLLIGVVAVATILTAISVFLGGRQYSVTSTLISTTGITGSNGGLAGLAQAAGLSLSANPTSNPEYYAELLQSDGLLRKVVETPVDSNRKGVADSILAQRIVPGQTDRDVLVRLAINKLRAMMSVSISQRSSLLTLTVKSGDPLLSMRLVTEIAKKLEAINQRARLLQNASEAEFIEKRLGDARAEVEIAENELRSFLARNRSFTDPSIELDRQRIFRKVEVARGTQISLASAFDRARIESLRNTPTITMLEPPRAPLGPDARGLVTKSLFAAFATTVLMLVLILIHELASALWPNSMPGAASAAGALRRVPST